VVGALPSVPPSCCLVRPVPSWPTMQLLAAIVDCLVSAAPVLSPSADRLVVPGRNDGELRFEWLAQRATLGDSLHFHTAAALKRARLIGVTQRTTPMHQPWISPVSI
jgi:hypothetical protein